MSWKRIGGLALALAASMAGTASAATPFNVGAGLTPDVKVDAAGKAHFAWIEQRGGNVSSPGQVHYCRMAVGATTCEAKSAADPPKIGNYPYEVAGPAEIFLNPIDGHPRIFTECYNCFHGGAQTRELIVAPDGSSVTQRSAGAAAGGVIGDIRTDGISAYDPAKDVLFGTDNYDFLRMPTPTPSEGDGARLSPFPGGSSSRGAAGFTGAGAAQVQVVVYVGRTSTEPGRRIRFLTHVGDDAGVNTAANWNGGDASIGFANDLSMDSGPTGVGLLTTVDVYNEMPPAVEYRRFDAATRTFSAPVTVASLGGTGDKDPRHPDLFQAPNGRLYAAWFDSGRIRYSTSADGTSWTTPENLVASDTVYDVHVAGTGAPDQGFVTWDTNYHADGVVKAAALTPVLPVTCPGDPRCPTTPPGGEKPPVTPPDPPAETVKTGTLGQLKFTLKAPKACVPASGKIAVSLKFAKRKLSRKAKRKLARKLVKLRKLALSVDGKAFSSSKRSPLTASVPASGRAAGSVVKLTLRVTYRQGRSKKNKTKTITTTVRVC